MAGETIQRAVRDGPTEQNVKYNKGDNILWNWKEPEEINKHIL